MNKVLQTAWIATLACGWTAAAADKQARLPDDARAFLKAHCIKCHGGAKPKGKVSLEDFDKIPHAIITKSREQVLLQEMPPDDKPQPSAREAQNFLVATDRYLSATGALAENKLLFPNYGNYIDHEALFRGPAHPAPATGVRAWRYRPDAYAANQQRGAIQPFALLPGQQVSDFSHLYSVDESSAEIVLRNAQQIVEQRTRAEKVNGKMVKAKGSHTHPHTLPLLDPDKAPTDEQFAQGLAHQFAVALQRKPTAEETASLKALYNAVSAKHGRLHAARAALTAPLLLPEAVYRLELGAGPLDEHGRRRLTKREIELALHFALEDRRFGAPTTGVTAKADLSTRAGVKDAVGKLLGGKPTPRVLKFFDEYFDYKKAAGVFKEPKGIQYNIGSMVRDTENLIRHVVTEDRDVLRTLLTTRKMFATNGTGYGRGTARIYGFPHDWKPFEGELVDLPADQRAGVLTHPAWLVAHSGNFDNDPVKRGKWILERLVGGTVPDVPISVDAVVPEDEHKTLRERFGAIRSDGYCWKCHERMNPLGMPFEAYDHFGRYRLKELKKPVVTTGRIAGTGDAKVDGDVSDPIELVEKLANHPRTQEVFVRFAFRFFMGRNETLRDAKTLREANAAYNQSGGSFKALVASLLSSDSFLYRTPDG